MTFQEAVDRILTVFKQAWDPTGYPAIYTDVGGAPPGHKTVWARAVVRHALGGQASLMGDDNVRRWERTGTVFVQVFAPIGAGSTSAYAAAQVVADAYQSARDPDVWFRNVRINEAGGQGAFQQINVLADFTYDDVR